MSLSNLKSLESKTFQTKKVLCDNYEVIVDIVFRESKIADMYKEMIKTVEYIYKNKIELDYATYGEMLIFKYFTDIDFGEGLENQMNVFKIIFDLGYTNIIGNSFDEKEMTKLTNKMLDVQKNIEKFNAENKTVDTTKKEETHEEVK